MPLVIVESPAKCKKIQGFLGDGWTVIASMGHIRALDQELDAIGLQRDFDARFVFMKEKAKTIAQIKADAKGITDIYLAADDDREGEAIAYSVALLLGLDPKKAKRAVFHEITQTAILKAVQNPRLLDMNKVDAQQARSILDMMVGFTISPLLWTYVGKALSAGRCQTPALRLVVEKERQISGFTSERAWKLRGSWLSYSKVSMNASMMDDLEDEESARNFLENLHDVADGKITSCITKPWSLSAPAPLITSTLQQEASARYGSGVKQTMQIAQRLYEAGHITYMRTDHAILSEEAKKEARELIQKEYGDLYVLSDELQETKEKKTKKAKEKKTEDTNTKVVVAQEAHEAIRPTHFDIAELPIGTDTWSSLDRNMYQLIRNRALQSVMSQWKGEDHLISFVSVVDADFPWSCKWKRTVFLGWKRVGFAVTDLDNENDDNEKDTNGVKETDDEWKKAISLKKDDIVKWTHLEAYPSDTKAVGRFNEATLVRELEKKGIGRPSTFASLIDTIVSKEYVKKETIPAKEVKLLHLHLSSVGQVKPTEEIVVKKVGAEKEKLVPTPLGVRILDFCLKEFSNLFDYSFTSRMETRLDMIAEGKEPWKQLCRDTWASYKDTIEDLRKNSKASAIEDTESRQKEFGGGLKAVLGKKGPILLQEDSGGDKEKTKFYGWPENIEFADMTEEKARAFILADLARKSGTLLGSFEGEDIFEKMGPFGKYYQCGKINLPSQEGDTLEKIQTRLTEKKASVLHSIGEYEFRSGQYGIYMYKRTTKSIKGGRGGKAGKAGKDGKDTKPIFVGLPSGLDPKLLTEEAAARIYLTGVQQKTEKLKNETGQGGRGGFGGRGRGVK